VSTADGDWLVLSLKWSRSSDHLVWYGPAACGYALNLEVAGRFTEAEALSHESGDNEIAVPLPAALAYARRTVLVPAEEGIVDALKAARRKAVAS
jgi:hypothetical protein